jgi:hypothetical protein
MLSSIFPLFVVVCNELSRADYLLSFFGLHFSQVLPSLAALTQHLCAQSFPAALAFSQQVSARAMLMLAKIAMAQANAVSALTDFMFCPL